MIDNPEPQPTKDAEKLRQRREEIEDSLSVVSTLTPADRRFVAHHLTGHNLKDSYLYANPTYDGQNARKLGWQWRRKEKIQAAIDEYFHQQEMGAREVIARLSQQAKAEYGRYLRWHSSKKEIYCDLEALLNDGLGHLIKKVGYDRTGTDSAVQVVEFYDAHTALVDVGRYHGLFTDKQDITSGGERLEVVVKYADTNDNPT